MTDPAMRGVVFPAAADGARSSSRLGRAVVADALRATDPVGALAAERETSWRSGYLPHLRRLVEAGLLSREAALAIARDGLASVHDRMRVVLADGQEQGLTEVYDGPPEPALETVTINGSAEPERELSLPYRGERLRGDALLRRLDIWVERGVVEPSCAEAVRTVIAHPEWLDLSGRRVVVLGAAAEMGPLRSLLRWGGDVVGVDLPRPDMWGRLLEVARSSAGRLSVPVAPNGADQLAHGANQLAHGANQLAHGANQLAHRAGADLVRGLPQVAAWLTGLDGPLVLGNYVYADGASNLRVAAAVDALTHRMAAQRPDLALAFLATPTDVFAVPGEAVDHAVRAYEARSARARLLGRPLRLLSGGRLLQRNYVPGSDPGLNDSLVPQQGPNYALAKRLQRWRATVARDAGTTVSFHVAPPTRTRSVLKNRALAAAYAGAHRFGVEVFEPATSNTLMAALLVHDLQSGVRPQAQPWQDEAYAAAHGGLWRCPYAPRSALGLAALLGVAGARG